MTGFSTLYRVDAIEAGNPPPIVSDSRGCFSTLYRVDAIEASISVSTLRPASVVSVPSIGSMLLKHPHGGRVPDLSQRFSTLYRVDAIEALPHVGRQELVRPFQYPLSGRCY